MVHLLVLGGVVSLGITGTPRPAEGCSGAGNSYSGGGGNAECTTLANTDIDLLFDSVPADGVIAFRKIFSKIPCGSPEASGGIVVTVQDQAGALVDGEEIKSPFEGATAEGAIVWKPSAPFAPNSSYTLTIKGVTAAPLVRNFSTTDLAPEPVATIKVDTPKKLIEHAGKALSCDLNSSYSGGCLPPVRASFNISRREVVEVNARVPPQFYYKDFYGARIVWDLQGPVPLKGIDYHHSGPGLPGRCIHAEVINLITKAISRSAPVCFEPISVAPETIDCDELDRAINNCKVGPPPPGGSSSPGASLDDVPALKAICSTLHGSDGGAGGEAGGEVTAGPGESSGCAQGGARGARGSWLWVMIALCAGARAMRRR